MPGFLNVRRYHENVKSLAHKKTIIIGKAHKITVDNYKRNPFKITQNDFLRNLKNYDYIGQISNELKEIFGVNKELNVSKETIYIYVFCKGELKKELREIKVSERGKNRKFLIYEVFQSALKKSYQRKLGRRFNYEKISLQLR